MEQTALRQVFNDAVQRRRINFVPLPKAPKTSQGDGRRPAFDAEEWKVLQVCLYYWSQGEGPYKKYTLNAYHKLQRQQLRAHVLFLGGSGLRPDEARKMRWEDVGEFNGPDGQEYFKVTVRADTKVGNRTVVVGGAAKDCLAEWYLLSGNPEPQDLVWHGQTKNGSKGDKPLATDLNKTFKAFLRGIRYKGRPNGLLCDVDGKTRPLYSLRHTYATAMLLDTACTELVLANNMGTSVAQIQRHYSHVRNTQKAAVLSSLGKPKVKPRRKTSEAIKPQYEWFDPTAMFLAGGLTQAERGAVRDQLMEDFGIAPERASVTTVGHKGFGPRVR